MSEQIKKWREPHTKHCAPRCTCVTCGDAQLFPDGFGEENDFALRAGEAGYALVVADSVYVWHAKSASYGVEVRKQLSTGTFETLQRKWGARLQAAVQMLEREPELAAARARIAAVLHHQVSA